MIEKQGNYDSCEAQEVRQQSEFLRRVHDFAEYMQKEYIAESDGEMSLFISAGDSTLGENGVGRIQCVMGQQWMVASGLASWLEDGGHREIFHQARRMADDYDDLPQRRKELHRQRRVLYTLMTVSDDGRHTHRQGAGGADPCTAGRGGCQRRRVWRQAEDSSA